MSDSEIQAMRERMIRLETIVGDNDRGLLAEINSMRIAIDGLKSFQLRILGGFGVLAILAQVAIQILLK